MRVVQPSSLDETLTLLSEGAHWDILAGGTDYFPALGDRPPKKPILDISRLNEIRGIEETDTSWKIGGLTSWTDIVRSKTLPNSFAALQQAAREVGSVQIQNMGSIAGNLCNASPAADGVPALLILDAEVELSGPGGVRTLPLSEFIVGNRQTVRQPDELLTAITIPKSSTGGDSTFLKLGSRKYLVISIVMVAVRLVRSPESQIEEIAISVGACSPVARRLTGLEQKLTGQARGERILETISSAELSELSPIDDIRGSAGYRRHAAAELIARAIGDCMEHDHER